MTRLTGGRPKVSFVIPCYNFAHLLPECVGSILSQTFEDFEVLIMDDCSPDATPEVAASFHDDRVLHVRNPTNLGHLRNYNKGIEMARGEYVWLISADDLLRRRYILEEYLGLMDRHPSVGFVICPAMKLENGVETSVYASHGPRNAVIRGRDFLRTLLAGNSVPVAAAMARKAAYLRVGMYPEDMPFAGDWYLWARLSLIGDVGYFAEPMVYYRVHPLNMTNEYLTRRAPALVADEVAVRWRILRELEAESDRALRSECEAAIAGDYAWRAGRRITEEWPLGLSVDEFERSLEAYARTRTEGARIRSVVYTAVADAYVETNRPALARQFYVSALRLDPRKIRTWAKLLLVHLGQPGAWLRGGLVALRKSPNLVRATVRGAQRTRL